MAWTFARAWTPESCGPTSPCSSSWRSSLAARQMEHYDDHCHDQALDEDLHARARSNEQKHVGDGGDDQRADDGAANRAPSAGDGAAADEDRGDRVERVGARDLQVDVLSEPRDENACHRNAEAGNREGCGGENRNRQSGGSCGWLILAEKVDFQAEPGVAHREIKHEREPEKYIDRKRQAKEGTRQEFNAGAWRRGDVAWREPAANAFLDGAGADRDDDRIGPDQPDQCALDREDDCPCQ